MIVLIEPDETRSSSLFPDSIRTKLNPGLEKLTGADFVISSTPILVNPKTMQWHLDNRSFFVQRKSGYDLFSYDALKRAIARMKACNIPPNLSILLYIGHYWQDKNGYVCVNNKKPYGKVSYTLMQALLSKWEGRGGVTRNINSEKDLPIFIDSIFNQYNKMKADGSRTVCPDKPIAAHYEPFQEIVELGSNDPRRILRVGLEGFGEKLGERLIICLDEHKRDHNLKNALMVLTYLDKKGKQVFAIPGWGKKSCLKLREIIGLKTNPKDEPQGVENLSTHDMWNEFDDTVGWTRGWFDCVARIKELAAGGMNGQEIMRSVEQDVVPF